jgi:hypothetical protein
MRKKNTKTPFFAQKSTLYCGVPLHRKNEFFGTKKTFSGTLNALQRGILISAKKTSKNYRPTNCIFRRNPYFCRAKLFHGIKLGVKTQ